MAVLQSHAAVYCFCLNKVVVKSTIQTGSGQLSPLPTSLLPLLSPPVNKMSSSYILHVGGWSLVSHHLHPPLEEVAKLPAAMFVVQPVRVEDRNRK